MTYLHGVWYTRGIILRERYIHFMGLANLNGSDTQQRASLMYLKPRHSEIARRLLVGQLAKQIERDLGMTQAGLSYIMNSPMFKLRLKQLEQARDREAIDITKQIKEVAPDALDASLRLMYSARSETVRMNVAQDLLDRAGYGAVTKIAAVTANVDVNTLQDEELRSLVGKRLEEMVNKEAKERIELQEAESIEVNYEVIPDKQVVDLAGAIQAAGGASILGVQ